MSLSSELAAAIEDEHESPTPKLREITIGQRMLSACSGSLVTSFAVTPFDVVRIRIHQQEVMNDCCQGNNPEKMEISGNPKGNSEIRGKTKGLSENPVKNGEIPVKNGQFPVKIGENPVNSNQNVGFQAKSMNISEYPGNFNGNGAISAKNSAIPGKISQSIGKDIPRVFWNTQQFCETARDCPKITSTFQGMMVIGRNEGVATLWRGLSLTLLMAVPSNIIYFTGYEYIKELSPITDHAINPLVCGSLARMMSATVVSPIELLKTRFQSVPNSASDPKHKIFKSLLRDSAQAFRKNGFGSMFTGLQITLWRDVPFSGIYWMCYESFKARFSRALDVDFNRSEQEDWKVFSASFCSGSLGGVVAAFFTNPFDVGKTRLQIASSETKKARPSMFQFLWRIRVEEGIGALYKGFAPRVLKIAPSCAIMISSYEIGKKLFQDGL